MKMKNILFLLVIVVATLSFTANANAEVRRDIQPRWSYINLIKSNLIISQNGLAEISATGEAFNLDEIRITANLQKYKDNQWTIISNYSNSSTGVRVQTGGQYMVEKGYSYKVETSVKAYIGGKLVETANETYEYGLFK